MGNCFSNGSKPSPTKQQKHHQQQLHHLHRGGDVTTTVTTGGGHLHHNHNSNQHHHHQSFNPNNHRNHKKGGADLQLDNLQNLNSAGLNGRTHKMSTRSVTAAAAVQAQVHSKNNVMRNNSQSVSLTGSSSVGSSSASQSTAATANSSNNANNLVNINNVTYYAFSNVNDSCSNNHQLTYAAQLSCKVKNAYVSLFDYDARTSQDLSFKKGDMLYIKDEDKENNGWWLAKFKTANDSTSFVSGYIPSQYVALYGTVEAQPWYFGATKRMEAEKHLMIAEHNENGSFLVRISDGNAHAYSLSVRDHDSVKHYRIRLSEDAGSTHGMYYITKRVPFATLAELIDYYSRKPDGLWVQLGAPCVKVDVPVTKGLTHSFMKDFEVDRKLFNLEKKIGQGQFGDVWQGRFAVNKMKVAIKTLKEGMNPTDFKAEAALMKNICHPKLIQLYGLCTTEEPIYIITELMCNGSLLDYLQTPLGKRLQIDTLIYIAAQIADGMAYLESRNYIHRDLAARNVLVGENNECKVADFGLARVVKDMSNFYAAREGTKFPIKWTAPEAAIYNKFSVKSDVWSFGIVLTEIITFGRTPYPSMSNQEVLQEVSRSYRMPQPSGCSDRLYQIMMCCWKSVPEDRPTFETLKYKLEAFFEEDDNKQYRDTHTSVNANGNSSTTVIAASTSN